MSESDNDTQAELAAWELLREAERERDEARKQNAKLRNIAKRAIEAIPHTEGYGEFSYAQGILRAELDQLKEGGK